MLFRGQVDFYGYVIFFLGDRVLRLYNDLRTITNDNCIFVVFVFTVYLDETDSLHSLLDRVDMYYIRISYDSFMKCVILYAMLTI